MHLSIHTLCDFLLLKKDNKKLEKEKIKLNEGINKIGKESFMKSNDIQFIEIGNNITSFEEYCFYQSSAKLCIKNAKEINKLAQETR